VPTMTVDRRPASPTVYTERRHVEAGVTSVLLTVCGISGTATLVGGDAAGARGALVPELLAMANRVLRNPEDAAALEVDGVITLQVHGSPLGVAVDDDGALTMNANNKLCLDSTRAGRVRYLAIAGGIEPFGTNGPGKPIDAGTVLRPGGRRGLLVGGPGRIDLRGGEAIGVRRPDGAAAGGDGAFEALCGASWKKSTSDRKGLGLAGAAKIAAGAASKVTRGAVVVGGDGQLVVVGPDHAAGATLPVVAIVDEADLGRLAARPLGADVTFVAR
jgi:hypothetical protein